MGYEEARDKLLEIRRGDPGTQVEQVLYDIGACDEAMEWIRKAIDRWPHITAQGLWNNCPQAEWLRWLVCRIVEREERNHANCFKVVQELDRIEDAEFRKLPWHNEILDDQWDKRYEKAALCAARAIRREYESPWL
jgi:hypothetical protein